MRCMHVYCMHAYCMMAGCGYLPASLVLRWPAVAACLLLRTYGLAWALCAPLLCLNMNAKPVPVGGIRAIYLHSAPFCKLRLLV